MFISRSCVAMLLTALPLTTQADQATQARVLASRMIQQPGAALKQELAANGPDLLRGGSVDG